VSFLTEEKHETATAGGSENTRNLEGGGGVGANAPASYFFNLVIFLLTEINNDKK
jgi:hypothetical protein